MICEAMKDMEVLKCILLSERRQSEKALYCTMPTISPSGKGKTMETEKDQWLPWVELRGGVNRWSLGFLEQ